MAVYALDTSALVKRYVPEVGSAWVRSLTDPLAGHRTCVARVTGVELVSAVARRQRGGTLAAAAAALIVANFRAEFTGRFEIIELTAALIDRAMILAETHALRGYDAVQLAAALDMNARCQPLGLAFTLISADVELNAAAAAEGLAVDDPNGHP